MMPDIENVPIRDLIIDDRLKLRRFSVDDASAMFDNWASDENVARYVKWTAHKDVDETRGILSEWCGKYDTEPFYYQWCIELDGEPIGSISLFDVDVEKLSGEIGYCIGKRWWGKGITTKCVNVVCLFAFTEVGLDTLRIKHASENSASGAVARHNNFIYEKTEKDAIELHDGRKDDLVTYVLTKLHWEETTLTDAMNMIAEALAN